MKVSLSSENLEKIKRITIKTRRIMMSITQGSARSVRKGMGLDFENLRDYMVGDDIRFIDWKASARSQSLLIKEFCQEQSLAIMIALDVSASMNFGSCNETKIESAFELASAIVLMAYYAGDSVGLVMYSDIVHVSIPPRKGALHMQYLLETIIGFKIPAKAKTNSAATIDFLLRQKLSNAFLFVISDGFENNFYATMSLFSTRYHLYIILCHDRREHQLPTGAWVAIRDNETGIEQYAQLKKLLNQFIMQYHQDRIGQLSRIGARIIESFSVDEGIDALVRIFNSTAL